MIYAFWGKVITGQKRGKNLGFPTANVRLHRKIPEGIYAATVQVQKKTFHAAVFIGSAKTFGEKDYKAEAFILDFSQKIYDQWLSVKLFKKLRENKKFSSEAELIFQMKQDVLATRKFFS